MELLLLRQYVRILLFLRQPLRRQDLDEVPRTALGKGVEPGRGPCRPRVTIPLFQIYIYLVPDAPMSDLFAVFLLLLLGWFWLDSLRAREIALGICKAACARRDLQFLDQAVALRRLGLYWGGNGIRLRRVYRFDFSEEGLGRRNGYLVMRGIDLEDLSFGLPDQTQDA